MPGEVNAARIWGLARRTPNGRRALAAIARGRDRITLGLGNPSTVTLGRARSRRHATVNAV